MNGRSEMRVENLWQIENSTSMVQISLSMLIFSPNGLHLTKMYKIKQDKKFKDILQLNDSKTRE